MITAMDQLTNVWTAPGGPADSRAEDAGYTFVGEEVARLMGYTAEPTTKAHPLCVKLRELRRAASLSLAQFEERSGIPAVVVGAYERGDRVPPLSKLEACFGFFGYRLVAIPVDAEATRVSTDMVADLRAIADQLESASKPRVAAQ